MIVQSGLLMMSSYLTLGPQNTHIINRSMYISVTSSNHKHQNNLRGRILLKAFHINTIVIICITIITPFDLVKQDYSICSLNTQLPIFKSCSVLGTSIMPRPRILNILLYYTVLLEGLILDRTLFSGSVSIILLL